MIISSIQGTGVPVPGNDLDTDRVIPARFLKEITFENMGDYLFYDVRFDEQGQSLNHPLDAPHFHGAEIMVVNKNFGCGSSREHAPQAIKRFGIKAIIGESFAEIFAGNCKEIGVPIVTASTNDITALQQHLQDAPQTTLDLNLETQQLTAGDFSCTVSMPDTIRDAFLNGTWDVLSLLLNQKEAISQIDQRLKY